MRSALLNIGVSLLAMTAASAAFAASEPPTEGAFTIVVLPDTQNYADVNQPRLNHYFKTQTQWIVDNRDKHDIRYVFTLGDIVQHNREDEWPIARGAYDILQEAGVPYSITGGNHDFGPNGNGSNWDSLLNDDRFFGPNSPYAQQPQIGGFLGEPGKTDSSWHTFEAGGKKWMIVSTEWAPRDFVLDAANEVIRAHPDHNVVITTHANIFSSSARYNADLGFQDANPKNYGVNNQPQKPNDGQEIWEKVLRTNPNVKLIMSGHVLWDGTGYLRSVGADGHIVNEYLTNFQNKPDGGQSWLKLLEFHPDGETVRVRSYNPHLDTYNLQADHEFSIVVTDKKVGRNHVAQTLEMKPRLYYSLKSADSVQRPWGQAIVNAGTLGPIADGVVNGATAHPYRFDGSNSLSVRGGLSPLRTWTVAGWVRATANAAGQSLIELRSGQGAGVQIELQAGDTDANQAYWTVSYGAGASTHAKIQDKRVLNPNNWYHLVATYADGALRFYVDGMLIEEQTGLGNGLSLGMTRPVIGEGLTGEVGEIAVFDRALGFGEVNQLHLSAFNRVIAGNIENNNPTIGDNDAAPVTVVEQSFPGISITQTNRGDHELFLGNALQSSPQATPTLGRPALPGDGVMLASVRQNSRDGVPISAEVAWNTFANAVLAVATADVGNTIPNSPKENNAHTAVAWFSYADGWTAGHVNRQGRLIDGNGATPDMFISLPLGERGRFIADLGVDTQNDGLLFTIGANNSFNLTAATPHEDGSAWDIRSVSNSNGAGVAADFSFVYLRNNLDGLIAGAFDGVADAAKKAFGTAAVSRLDTGLYRIAVPNETPETGMLVLSAADVSKVAALSYEANEDGSFIVQAIDPVTAQRTDTVFNWAFVSFENPIEFEGDDNLGVPHIVMPDDQITPPIDPLNFATACIDTYTNTQDLHSIYQITDGGAGLAITGNGRKQIFFDYTITPNTIVEFDFSSRVEPEVAAISLTNSVAISDTREIKVYGTQAWGVLDYDTYSGNGAWQNFRIPVGQYYTGEIDRIALLNDQDAAPFDTVEANYRNIKVYEDGQPVPPQPITFDRCDVTSHGETSQDFATYEILSEGLELKLDGNGRKRVEADYLITSNTVLEFEFRSETATEGEIHAIGLDNNNNELDSTDRMFQVFGVQPWGNTTFADYEGDGQWKSYRIPVGQFYTGLARNVFFVSDDDRPGTSPASSSWRNVRVYEGDATN